MYGYIPTVIVSDSEFSLVSMHAEVITNILISINKVAFVKNHPLVGELISNH
jgi:hypothetical protein